MSGLLRTQLVAIRESARALVAQADAILAALDGAAVDRGRTGFVCPHPAAQRISAPAMGTPARVICGVCEMEVAGVAGVAEGGGNG